MENSIVEQEGVLLFGLLTLEDLKDREAEVAVHPLTAIITDIEIVRPTTVSSMTSPPPSPSTTRFLLWVGPSLISLERSTAICAGLFHGLRPDARVTKCPW